MMHRTTAGQNVTRPVKCCRCAAQPVQQMDCHEDRMRNTVREASSSQMKRNLRYRMFHTRRESTHRTLTVTVTRPDRLWPRNNNAEIGWLVRLRLSQAQPPVIQDLASQSEAAKELAAQCDQLEVHDGPLYRQ